MSLRVSGGIDGRTHYHGCWRDHHDCAVRLLEDAAPTLEPLAELADTVWDSNSDDAQLPVRPFVGDLRRVRDLFLRIRGTG